MAFVLAPLYTRRVEFEVVNLGFRRGEERPGPLSPIHTMRRPLHDAADVSPIGARTQ
jgi:hypothetical protein